MPALSAIIGPNFYELHNAMKADLYDEVWSKGGRGSLI